MRPLASLTLVAGLVALAVAQDKKKEKYVSKDHGYAIAFPGEPKLKETKQETKVGDIKINTAEWRSTDGTQFLAVSVTKLPFPKEKYDPKKGLDGAARGGVGAGFKNSEVKEIEFGKGKLPGRDVVSENAEKKLYARAKLVFNPDNMSLYQVNVIGGSKDFVHGKDVDVFLASFELTAK